MRISYSAINTYQSCPLKYKYQEIDKIRTAKTKEAVFGNSIHQALHFMFIRNPLYPIIDEVLNLFTKDWLELAEKIKLNEEEKNLYKEEGLLILKNFYKKNQPWNFNIVDLESRFEFPLTEENETHAVSGIIDRIDKNSDDEYEIIDYKTASRMPSQEIIDRDLQMSIYYLGILNRWPHLKSKNIKLSLYFLKHGEKISTFRLISDMNKIANSIIFFIKEISERKKGGNFPAQPSALCGWCGYKQICPMWKHQYQNQESKIKNQEEIKEIIKEYVRLKEDEQKNKKKIAELQSELHNFMDANSLERVFAENGYVTRRLKETFAYDLEKAKEILEPLGKWKEFLKIDETALNRAIPKLSLEARNKFKEIVRETKITKTLTINKIKA